MSRQKNTASVLITHNITESSNSVSNTENNKSEKSASAVTITATNTTESHKRYAVIRDDKQDEKDLCYTLLLPWELNANEKKKSNTSIFIVEEEFSGRAFSVSENSVYSFIEFLMICAGRREFLSKLDEDKSNLFYLTDNEFRGDEYVKFNVHRREIMRRILFNNPVLNQNFMQQHSGYTSDDVWDKWKKLFLQVNYNENMEEALKELAARLFKDQTFEFKDFYSKIDRLRSTSFDNVIGVDGSDTTKKNIRWESRMLFPYCQEALYLEQVIKRQRILYFRGHGQILYWMLALSGDSERQKRISHLLCEKFLDSKNEQADFIQKFLAQNDKDISEQQSYTAEFFPIRYKCELFEHYAEDIEHVLNLNLVQTEMFDVLQRLSSLYLILFLLERSSLINARCNLSAQKDRELIELSKQYQAFTTQEELSDPIKSKESAAFALLKDNCNVPYFLLSFDSRFYLQQCKKNYDSITTYVSIAIKNFVRFKIERELNDEQYFRIVSSSRTANKKNTLNKDDFTYLKHVVQQVFAFTPKEINNFEKDKDFDYEKFKGENYTHFLNKINKRLKKRRTMSNFNIDEVVAQLARNIGLASLSSNRVHFAVTDGFLKMLVLVTCDSSSPISNKEFLEKIFARYHFIVGIDQLESLQEKLRNKNAISDQYQITADAIEPNEKALKERLNNQRLCCELSDNSFYYIFNPYKSKNER